MVPGAKRSNPAKPGSLEETLAFRPGSFILLKFLIKLARYSNKTENN
jgi:hypothetical protein